MNFSELQTVMFELLNQLDHVMTVCICLQMICYWEDPHPRFHKVHSKKDAVTYIGLICTVCDFKLLETVDSGKFFPTLVTQPKLQPQNCRCGASA